MKSTKGNALPTTSVGRNLPGTVGTASHRCRSAVRVAVVSLFALILTAVHAAGQTLTAKVPVGTDPVAIAVNPVTNKIYVANYYSANVTIIDGASNSTSTVAAGIQPDAVAVNPVTNQIYVTSLDGNLTVIDGATNNTSVLKVGDAPVAVALNPVTNQIYVVNQGVASGTVSVIDGGTNNITTVQVGTDPEAIALNPLTNQIYVVNQNGNNVTVIDGATNATSTINVGNHPGAVSVNPVTNKIYVLNRYDNTVTVIDGATNRTKTFNVDSDAMSLATNPVSNQIYVASWNTSSVNVFDGSNNTFMQRVSTWPEPMGVGFNTLNNQIGIGALAGRVTMIGGTNGFPVEASYNLMLNSGTNSSRNVANARPLHHSFSTSGNRRSQSAVASAGSSNQIAVAINPVTDKIYVANGAGNNVGVIDGAINSTTTVGVQTQPAAAVVNPVTNQIYVANAGSSDVTVIDGPSNNTTGVNAGTTPNAVALDAAANRIYVSNAGSNNVTVIDGFTNSSKAIKVGTEPSALGVNPVTAMIYVANKNSNNVTVINGVTNTTKAIKVGASPVAIAVNPVTNQIYVADEGSNQVTEIDGATSSTTPIAVGTTPIALAVNQITNQIYVVNRGSNNVTVIDGINNSTSTVAVGNTPVALDVNTVSNKIYVTNSADGTVTVVDGVTNSTTTLSVGTNPVVVVVNPVTNKIYVANENSNNVTVIDGVTNFTSTVATGTQPVALAVNPVTNAIYVMNSYDGTVTVINEQQVQAIPLNSTVTPLPHNWTGGSTPAFSFTATSTFSPSATVVENLLFQVDTWQGPWTAATNQGGGNFSATLPSLQQGFHLLYVYATDGQEASSTITGVQNNPTIGNITAYGFLVAPNDVLTTPSLTVIGGSHVYNSQPHAATCTATGINGITVSGTCTFTYDGGATPPTDAGTYNVTAVFTSKTLGYSNAEATGTITITPAVPLIKVTGSPVVYNGLVQSASCTATGVNSTVVSGSCSFTYNGSANPPTNGGSYNVIASFTSSNVDYQNATGAGTFKVTPAPLTITANNATYVQGFTFPTFSVAYAGFVNGETSAVLQGTLHIKTTATTKSPLGTYPITASGLTSSNYKIAYVTGTLTVIGPGPSPGKYNIQNLNSGLVLGVAGASTSEGANIVQWNSIGSLDQQWILSQSSTGAYLITDVNSGMVIGVTGASLSSATPLIQWLANSSPDQSWYFVQNGSNWIIQDVNSGMNMDISGASTAAGAQAIQYSADGGSSQMWSLIPVL